MAAIAIGCGSGPIDREPIIVPVADRALAPAFSLPNLRGGRDITLARYAGRPVVINFWASWCEPCKRETPAVAAFARENPAMPVLGIAVSDAPGDSRRFAERMNVDFDLASDRSAKTSDAYSVTGLPVTVLVDDRGRVASTWIGEITRSDLDTLTVALGSSSR